MFPLGDVVKERLEVNRDESLTLGELKRILMQAAARFDGTPAGRTELEVVIESSLWLAHGRGAVAVVRGEVRR